MKKIKTVYGLGREQLEELKEAYVIQLEECGENNELTDATEISDEVIFHHYGEVTFTDDDFFCSSGK